MILAERDGVCHPFHMAARDLAGARLRAAIGRLGYARLRRSILPFQDPRPVEIHSGVGSFDQLDRVFIERRASDPDAGRGSKPIKDARVRLALPPVGVDDEGVFVAELIPAESQIRQGYFLF
jgi:hypothetical protein